VISVRPSAVAVVALVAAFLGATGALAVGKATGWLDDGETYVVREGGGNGSVTQISSGSEGAAARPLPGNDFDPATIYRERAEGVVTVLAIFREGDALGNEAQGSGFIVSDEGYVLTNSHVITTAGDGEAQPRQAIRAYVVFRDGDRVEAEVVGFDPYVRDWKLDAERAETAPKVFTRIHLHYLVKGRGLARAKVERAIALSAEKYCSASAMLAKTAAITHDFELVDTAAPSPD